MHEVYEELVTILSYATNGSSGMDLHAHLPGPCNKVQIYPSRREVNSTGIEIEIPPGYEGKIRPRSGLDLLHDVTLLNTPGTIGSDYRGKISVFY